MRLRAGGQPAPGSAAAVTDQSTRYWYSAYKALMTPFLRVTTRIEVQGRAQVPQRGPFILVSNHRSNQDPPVLGSGSVRALRIPRYKSVKLLFGRLLHPGTGKDVENRLLIEVRGATESLQASAD